MAILFERGAAMHEKRQWADAIVAGIGALRFNNPVRAQGKIFAPSGGLNRYIREYLESEGGIVRKTWLRDIWETKLGNEIREQLKGTPYLINVVVYELDQEILDCISHRMSMHPQPKLVVRMAGCQNRLIQITDYHYPSPEPDNTHVGSWQV